MTFADTSISTARKLDSQDDLREFRQKFRMNDPGLIYLDGNSLGRLPEVSIERVRKVVEHEWGERLIRSWNEGWIDAPARIGAKIARLIGAGEDEVIVTDATSLNLFKLAVAGLKYNPERKKVISDELNFPSDLYILQGVVDLLGDGYELHLAGSPDGIVTDPQRIENLLGADSALLSLTHTCFKSAFVHDMARLTRSAHQHGAMVLWDLSHSVGALEIDLNACGVDMAVGCTYKYLNGGPGAPAFLYVRKDLQEKLMQPVWGWLGSEEPFAFNANYKPAGNMDRFQVGTPPVLSMLALEPGLDIHLEAGMHRLRKKSIQQTEYLVFLFDHLLESAGFSLGSPRNPDIRGSHVSLKHPEAYRICQAMIEADPPEIKIIPDFRSPDNIRLGIASVYTSFEDIHRAVLRISEIMEKGSYLDYEAGPLKVT